MPDELKAAELPVVPPVITIEEYVSNQAPELLKLLVLKPIPMIGAQLLHKLIPGLPIVDAETWEGLSKNAVTKAMTRGPVVKKPEIDENEDEDDSDDDIVELRIQVPMTVSYTQCTSVTQNVDYEVTGQVTRREFDTCDATELLEILRQNADRAYSDVSSFVRRVGEEGHLGDCDYGDSEDSDHSYEIETSEVSVEELN